MADDDSLFRELLAFVERLGSCSTRHEVIDELARFIAPFGFATVGMGHIINPARHKPGSEHVFQLSNWPVEWSRYWALKGLMMRDPIARYALTHDKPFLWKDAFEHVRSKDHAVEKLMREFGFSEGIAFPMDSGEDYQLGIVSLGAEHMDISRAEQDILQAACTHAYRKIEELYGAFPYQSFRRLTPRETEVLHFAAGGKTDWEIGRILSLGQATVRDHMTNVAKKLGTRGRTNTVAVAIYLGLVIP